MKLIRKGAEGDLFLTTWNGKEAILKSRKKKDYRNSSLDYRLRNLKMKMHSQLSFIFQPMLQITSLF